MCTVQFVQVVACLNFWCDYLEGLNHRDNIYQCFAFKINSS